MFRAGQELNRLYSFRTTTNTASFTKKTVTNAMFITCFGLANVIGTFLFQARDKPDYLPGKIAVLTLFALMLPTVTTSESDLSSTLQLVASRVALIPFRCFAVHFYTGWLNKRAAKKLAALTEEKGWTPEDVEKERDRAAFMDLSDRENPFFVYMS